MELLFSNLPVDIIHHQVVCPYPSFRLSRSTPFLICFHIPHICIRTTTLSHSPYPQRLARASQPNATTEYRNSQGAQSLAREHSSKFMFPRGITSLQALAIQALRLSRECQDITVVWMFPKLGGVPWNRSAVSDVQRRSPWLKTPHVGTIFAVEYVLWWCLIMGGTCLEAASRWVT